MVLQVFRPFICNKHSCQGCRQHTIRQSSSNFLKLMICWTSCAKPSHCTCIPLVPLDAQAKSVHPEASFSWASFACQPSRGCSVVSHLSLPCFWKLFWQGRSAVGPPCGGCEGAPSGQLPSQPSSPGIFAITAHLRTMSAECLQYFHLSHGKRWSLEMFRCGACWFPEAEKI